MTNQLPMSNPPYEEYFSCTQKVEQLSYQNGGFV